MPVILAVLAVGVVAFPLHFSSAATTATERAINTKGTGAVARSVVGMGKFVLQGSVTAVSTNVLTLHVTNTSKNAKVFDGKDKTLNIGSKTVLTKNGKNIALAQIKAGNKVKVFGIFDKKTGAITLVRWVKVVSK